MPLFNWQCQQCGKLERKLLPKRPKLGTCCCGGRLKFVTAATTRVVEVRDNGAMPRTVEQLEGIDEMVKDRSDGT